MGQTLDNDSVKKIIEEELEKIVESYNLDIQSVEIDTDAKKVDVTFGLKTAEDDYIGLLLD